ncbi:formin-like protein 16 [Lactuca sativa]|uniref:Vegetative cell wall protein gp1-like n=1 Tax=Lactuca sativa TaxID=4236 RepID=A0A9R1VYQ3_LACSA|nr:formin-like protein 16 [Lactuca sativa]KAJ0215090.1 hypothetical protein LSAT_V11C300156570 [Lactuca sativa]
MATQQGAPSRPWFRLATMVRPPPPPAAPPQPDQAPPPPPRPAAFMRPAFSQTFRVPPTVPPPQTTATPPAVSPPRPAATLPAANGVAPTSPPQPPAGRASPPPPSPKETSSSTSSNSPMQQSRPPSPVTTPHVPPPQPSYSPPPIPRSSTPTYSPPKPSKPLEKKSPPSPPNPISPVSHPPSPLALPSPQLKPEYEQKTMVVQETKEIPKNLDKGFNGDIRRHSVNWGTRNPKKPETSKKHSHSDSEDGGMRIITIAGENKGAIMELSPFGKKTHSFGDNPHMKKDSPTPTSTKPSDGEKSDGKSKAIKSKSPLMSAVMNSNVQGVNNSILYNCSTSHHDPGVHLSLSRKPMAFNSKLKDHIN